MLRFLLFGPFEAFGDDGRMPVGAFRTRQARAALKLLLAEHDRPVPFARLADAGAGSACRLVPTFTTRGTTIAAATKSAPMRRPAPITGIGNETRAPPGTTRAGASMEWIHPHPPCAETTDHRDVVVMLSVSGEGVAITCAYVGSASGPGPECRRP